MLIGSLLDPSVNVWVGNEIFGFEGGDVGLRFRREQFLEPVIDVSAVDEIVATEGFPDNLFGLLPRLAGHGLVVDIVFIEHACCRIQLSPPVALLFYVFNDISPAPLAFSSRLDVGVLASHIEIVGVFDVESSFFEEQRMAMERSIHMVLDAGDVLIGQSVEVALQDARPLAIVVVGPESGVSELDELGVKTENHRGWLRDKGIPYGSSCGSKLYIHIPTDPLTALVLLAGHTAAIRSALVLNSCSLDTLLADSWTGAQSFLERPGWGDKAGESQER